MGSDWDAYCVLGEIDKPFLSAKIQFVGVMQYL
jgi:hypothetical protein